MPKENTELNELAKPVVPSAAEAADVPVVNEFDPSYVPQHPDLEQARQVLELEAEAVSELAGRLGDEFLKAIDILFSCQGKVVVTGMGKSGHIASKIAATFASTGMATSACWLRGTWCWHFPAVAKLLK
jgi:hypothetical protein